jgi:hypothetical protein
MLTSDHLEGYLGLLRIRQAAWRRDAIITGGLFLVSALVIFASGLLGAIDGRSAYLVLGVFMAMGFGFLSAWVRLEIVKALMELADTLQRATDEGTG